MNLNKLNKGHQTKNDQTCSQVKVIRVLSNGRVLVKESTGYIRLAARQQLEVHINTSLSSETTSSQLEQCECCE